VAEPVLPCHFAIATVVLARVRNSQERLQDTAIVRDAYRGYALDHHDDSNDGHRNLVIMNIEYI